MTYMNRKINKIRLMICGLMMCAALMSSCSDSSEPYFVTTSVEPTCETAGVEVWSVGKNEYENRTIAALGHQYDNGTVVLAPTCTATGIMEYTCTRCGVTYKNTIAKKDHVVTEMAQASPTCMEYGSKGGTLCRTCGMIMEAPTIIEPLGHDYVTETDVPATCTAEGTTVLQCQRCHDTSLIKTPTLAHDYSVEKIIITPTCRAAGMKAFICAVCGDQITEAMEKTTDHTYVTTITALPECETTGVKKTYCTVCGYSYEEVIPAVGHDVKTEAAVSPTCISVGYTTAEYCAVCGITIKAPTIIEPLGHDYVTETDVPATCTAEGTTVLQCQRCHKTDLIKTPILAHDYSVEIIMIPPTCLSTGLKVLICAACGNQTTQTMGTTDHTYVTTITTQPGYDTPGVKKIYCTVCGYSYEEVIPATGPGN